VQDVFAPAYHTKAPRLGLSSWASSIPPIKEKNNAKRLEGKTAIITGAQKGLAWHGKKLFAQEGAYVFIRPRQKELDDAVKAIGRSVSGVQGDVAKLPLESSLENRFQGEGANRHCFATPRGEFVPFGAVTKSISTSYQYHVRGTLSRCKGLPLLNDCGSIILNGLSKR